MSSEAGGVAYPCPACGFEVFDSPPGSYELCPVCDWEDDGVQLRFPEMRGGANGESLFEWQRLVLPTLPVEIQAHDGYRRCSDWRPLRNDEVQTAGAPTTGLEYFHAIDAAEVPYYWRRPVAD